MLRELHIKNVAVIDEVNIEFGKGFNVLTGETGAGKSILIDSLNMALGQRTGRELIRHGAEAALVDAVFEVEDKRVLDMLSELDIDAEEENGCVILSRKITAEGKSVCRINGRTATVSMVKEVGGLLIDIHGQSDNQDILNPNKHIKFIDEYGKNNEQLSLYSKLYEEYLSLKKEYERLSIDDKDKAQRLDLLKFQIDEISSAKLKIGEEEELEKAKEYLRNSGNIMSGLSKAYTNLYGGDGGSFSSAYDLIASSSKALSDIAEYDEKLSGFSERIESSLAELEEVSRDIRKYLDGIEFDDEQLNYTEERLSLIYSLKRKYGGSIYEILEYLEKITDEARGIENSDEKLNEIKEEINKIVENLEKHSKKLTLSREKAAKSLENSIMTELSELDMPKVKFKVLIEKTEDFTRLGCDKVEFLISTNPGEDLKPLTKIASGGEMSRIMLAVKTILADSDMVEAMIFDEIDTGVSGRAAQKIAEKMDKLSIGRQILSITHLPQIAAMADNNYLIQKTSDLDNTTTSVIRLEKENRKTELARIIGGVTVTELTLRAAQEMIDMAAAVKTKNRN